MADTRDAGNPTYQSSTAQLFDAEGGLVPFQRAKYHPKVERLVALGVGSHEPILDVGIGYGAWLSHLEREGFDSLFGMDPFEGSIAMAREHCGAELRQGRIEDEDWPFEPHSFAVVTSFDVIEHLVHPPVFLERAARYLRPGGVAVVTTPLLEIGYRCRRLPWLGVPDTNPTHINVQPPRYWRRLVERSAFELIEAWRGESLTHIKHLTHVSNLLERLRVDHRRIPWIRQFEQSYCLTLRLPAGATRGSGTTTP